jgi:hypothetical protein
MTGSSSSILCDIDEEPQSETKQARDEADLICARLSQLPAVPVTAMMMVMVVMMPMPAVPPVMMVVAVPPMHFRGLGLHVLLNGRGGAGIAERDRIGRACECQHSADGGEPQ